MITATQTRLVTDDEVLSVLDRKKLKTIDEIINDLRFQLGFEPDASQVLTRVGALSSSEFIYEGIKNSCVAFGRLVETTKRPDDSAFEEVIVFDDEIDCYDHDRETEMKP